MSQRRTPDLVVIQVAAQVGQSIAAARASRRWTLRELGAGAGVSVPHLSALEHGRPGSLETYAALALALGLDLRLDLVDPRRGGRHQRDEDPVHAAMGEIIAARMASHGFTVAIDEPYQHFQFAGRADVLAWDPDARHLLHVENRTRSRTSRKPSEATTPSADTCQA